MLKLLRDARKLTHRHDLHQAVAQHTAMMAGAQGAFQNVSHPIDRSSRSETNIAELHVHSQARDASSIARDMHAALLAKREAAEKGNYGLA